MKIRDLQVFDAVAATGSIQGAAEAVGLTQSAVTRLVKRLEADLGVVLLDRMTRPVSLTREGHRAIAHTRQVLDAIAAMEQAFSDGRAPTGPFRLGISHAVAGLVLQRGDMLGLDRFPDLQPKITTAWSNDITEGLEKRTLDAGILVTRPNALTSPPLAETAVHVVGPRDSPSLHLSRANEIGWALNPEGCGYRRALTSALASIGETPNIVMETNSLELQLSLAGHGGALTLAPDLPDIVGFDRFKTAPVPVDGFQQTVAFHLRCQSAAIDFHPVFEALERRLRETLTKKSI